ncbi:Calcineurin-like phosphoesterase superfamily domain protein [Pelagimonas phthalicica]|uniref:Calcineurin-like phosphoesterase superfamily domain protein n=2 Tax=Pelagimonas phthalicica TaxID=1037362 RepID=A0A238JBW0_9RHOB|nr:calcineurin-like phosphoesterase family protein [Pelagimonas phthalicica]SMX28079.1 Calcineurin-like phosphoesterase superfamily domain protein [Pelagimonas phthalicica]
MEAFHMQHLFDDDAPVLIFGGPYSNLQATQAMRAEASRHGIPADHCICTGDVVAYCGDPVETINEIRDWGCAVIAGNCERQLAVGADDCGCGFDEGSTCDLLSVGWYRHANALINEDARDWMRALPDAAVFTHQRQSAVITHGGFTNISRFLWSVSPEQAFLEELQTLAAKSPAHTAPNWIFAGHSGIPFQRQIGASTWVNAGVIGMPPHDGQTETRYALLQDGQVSFHSLTYDVDAAYNSMMTAGLTQGYHQGLTSGYWPSEDVLPPTLRRPPPLASLG